MTNHQPLQVGDRVGYRKAFLQSTGQYTGAAPFGRGTVVTLTALGSREAIVAEIDWGTDELPARIHVANLATVAEIALGY